MAQTCISEFTFGYAFLYEQTRRHWKDLKAAPILPSLQKEADEGWDAQLPTSAADYYYQFKISEHLTRSNSLFHKELDLFGPIPRGSILTAGFAGELDETAITRGESASLRLRLPDFRPRSTLRSKNRDIPYAKYLHCPIQDLQPETCPLKRGNSNMATGRVRCSAGRAEEQGK